MGGGGVEMLWVGESCSLHWDLYIFFLHERGTPETYMRSRVGGVSCLKEKGQGVWGGGRPPVLR